MIRCVLGALLMAISGAFHLTVIAQAPPFSYRGVYETTLSGAKIVFYVADSTDSPSLFGYINPSSQVVASSNFSPSVNGSASFSTTAGNVVANFTGTGVSGTIGGQPFSAPRTVLNSVQGNLQGGYTGTLWFQADGSLNYASFVLTPAGNIYALANTTAGLQGGIGTYSQNGTFTATGYPGALAISGSGTLTSGVFNGTYSVAGTTAYFNATRENLAHHLVNISTRGSVGSGANQLIAGFVIRNGAKRVMIRAIGPSLSGSVPGTLSDPFLTLLSGSTVIATNDNWQTGNDVNAINATGFAPTDPRESSLLVTLKDGAFTAIVSGVGGTTGVALVEVYEID